MTIVCELLSGERVSRCRVRAAPGEGRAASGAGVLRDRSVAGDLRRLSFRTRNLRGTQDPAGDWISRGEKHGPEVQRLTLLAIEKPSVSLFWGEDTPLSPKEEGAPERRGRGEK